MREKSLISVIEFIFYPSSLNSFVYSQLIWFSSTNNLILKKIIINNNFFYLFTPRHVNKYLNIFSSMKDFFANSNYLTPVLVIFKLSNKFCNILPFNAFLNLVKEEKIEIIKFVIEFINKQNLYTTVKTSLSNNTNGLLKILWNIKKW